MKMLFLREWPCISMKELNGSGSFALVMISETSALIAQTVGCSLVLGEMN